MMLRIVVVLALAAAVAFSPFAATAHGGRDHAKKAKKVKKSKAKQAAVEWRLARPAA